MTTTEHLNHIADYLERQTDLAFLTYRRQEQERPGNLQSNHLTATLYSYWIGVGDAYYLVQDTLRRHESQLAMWRDFLLALMARGGHQRVAEEA